MSAPATQPMKLCADDWASFLSTELQRPVVVRFGRARRNVVVARETGGVLHVRLNSIFGEAPADVRAATAAWLRAGKRAGRACARLDGWIEEIAPRLVPTRQTRIRTAGDQHDLVPLARDVFDDEFDDADYPLGDRPRITWGRRPRLGPRRSLLLGSFDPTVNLVRVHPVLDQAGVPCFFVRYILFHEILHAVVPTERRSHGRAVHHGPKFRAREQGYAGYAEALAWQADHLAALLRSARSGKPIPARRRIAAHRPSLRGALASVQRMLFPD